MRELGSADQPSVVFTFFSEKEGSTLVEQFTGKNLREALVGWYGESMVRPGTPLEDDQPAPVQTVKNVWCISGHDGEGKFFLTHIVATAP